MAHQNSVLVLAATLAAFPAPALAEFRVHEWGTFTSLVGSDGVSVDGMTHEDERLPEFVHGFGEVQPQAPAGPVAAPRPARPRNCEPESKGCIPRSFLEASAVTQKMETPVIYFHSDIRRKLEVDVRFPEGVISQTYPAPVTTYPTPSSPPGIGNGSTQFRVDVLSPAESLAAASLVPQVGPSNIYGHARKARSNLVQAGSETEQFIFYRGLGRFQPRVEIRSSGGALSLTQCAGCDAIPSAFLVHVSEGGKGTMLPLGTLAPGELHRISAESIRSLRSGRSGLQGTEARTALVAALEGAGLFHDEADAMISTWEHGYLATPGLRLLYVLPRPEVEQILPLSVAPQPEVLARAFVGRVEVLLEEQEQSILTRVLDERDGLKLESLGRFAEPVLHRLKALVQRSGSPAGTLPLLDRLIERARQQ